MAETLINFHDGAMTGIHVGKGFALLSLERENGEAWQVRLDGLDALKMDDFRQGNIILSFDVTVGATPERESFDRLFEAPHSLAAPEYHEAHAHFIARKMAMVADGSATLVRLTPSYGADLMALCQAVFCDPMPVRGI